MEGPLAEAIRSSPVSISGPSTTLLHADALERAKADGWPEFPLRADRRRRGYHLRHLLGEQIDVGVLAGSEACRSPNSGAGGAVIAALGGDRIPYSPENSHGHPEQGYEMNMGVEYMWLMPGGTPQDRVTAFQDALGVAMSNPELNGDT